MSTPGRPAWARERGSFRLLRLMIWITLHLGWPVARALLLVISAYFFLAAPRARAASRDFLARARGRPATASDVFRHIHVFASAIMESVFLLSGRDQAFDVRVEGLEALRRAMAGGQGCVLLGAHFGSFEVLRAVGRQAPVPVRPVMFREDHGRATRLIEALDPGLAERVIELGTPDAMLLVREAVARGELVGMLADRSLDERKCVRVPFLGAEASFPLGPLMVAASLSVPVLLFFGIRTGPRRYRVEFVPLAERFAVPRAERAAALERAVARYASELEARCREHPFNWFNFYPFWGAKQPARRGRFLRRAVLASLMLAAMPAAAQTNTWFDTLMQRLAAIPAREARFTETRRIAALTTPIVSHGTLAFRRPDRFEKITTDPVPETMIVEGDRLSIKSGDQPATVLALSAQPAIAGLVESLRAALAGDVAALQRYDRIEAQGSFAGWTMLLTPATPPLARIVRSVSITGRGTEFTGVRITQANGDEQSMVITGMR